MSHFLYYFAHAVFLVVMKDTPCLIVVRLYGIHDACSLATCLENLDLKEEMMWTYCRLVHTSENARVSGSTRYNSTAHFPDII